MIFKNDTFDVKILPFVRIFLIVFALFLTFFLGRIELSTGSRDIVGLLLIEFVPIMFVIIILFEACFTKYIDSIEINQNLINIKYGNGYNNKILSLNKNDIISFNVDIVTVNRWYFSRGCRRYITFDTIINVYLKNGNRFLLRDNHSGLKITKLLCFVHKEIPNFKFISTIPKKYYTDVLRELEQVRIYYNKLLNNN